MSAHNISRLASLPLTSMLMFWLVAGCADSNDEEEQASEEPKTVIVTVEETVERTVEQTTAESAQASKTEPKQPPPLKGKDKASEQPEVIDGLVIGDTATLSNGLAITVNGATVQLPPEAPKGKARPEGKEPPNRAQEGEVYVLVNITIANNGDEVHNIAITNFDAFDAQGYRLRAAAPSQVPSTREWTGEFRPGQIREGTVSFVASPDRSVTFRFENRPGPRGSRAEWELGPIANMPVA